MNKIIATKMNRFEAELNEIHQLAGTKKQKKSEKKELIIRNYKYL